MPKINFLNLKAEINKEPGDNNSAIRPYFLYGNEKYLVKQYEKLLIKFFSNKYGENCETQTINDDKFNIDKFKDTVITLPFLSEKKIIVVRDLDVTKFSASELKKLDEILSDLPESVILLVSQRLLEVNPKKSSKWKKFIDNYRKNWVITEFEILDKTFIEKQVLSWAKNSNMKVSKSLVKLMISRCGNDLNNLRNEMAKVVLLETYNKSDEITENTILNSTIETSDSTVFDMIRAIMRKDKKSAFQILNKQLENREEPNAVCGALASNYINIFRAKTFKNLHKNINDIMEIFNYKGKEFLIRNAMNYAATISIEKISECIQQLLNAEILLKSSNLDPEIILKELLIKLCKD